MNSKISKYSLYKKFFAFYVLIVLSTIVIVSLMTYSFFHQSMKNDLSAYITNSLVLSSSSNNSIMNEISVIQNSVITNNKAIYLLFGDEPNYVYEYEVHRELHRIMTFDAYINSVMLYNGKIRRLIYELPSNILETELNRQINTSSEQPIIRMLPWVQRLSSSEVNRISFTLDTDLSIRSESGGAIIISMTENVLKKRLADLSFTNQSILVLDDRGIVISSAEKYQFLDDLSDLQWVQDIRRSQVKSGGFIIRDGQLRFMVSYVKANYFGWTYISLMPVSVLGIQSLVLRNTLVAIAILIALFTLGALLVHRKLFNPMSRLFSYISHSAADRRSNEFEQLENTFNNQVDTINQLENTIYTFKPVLHQAYMLSLLEGCTHLAAASNSLLPEVSDATSSSSYTVMIFRPYFSAEADDQQRSTLDELSAMIKAALPSEFVTQPGIDLLIICKANQPFDLDQTKHSIRVIQNRIIEMHHMPVSAAIGDTVDKLELVTVSYQSAREVLRYSFFYDPGTILTPKTITDNHQGPVPYPFSIECSIKQAIKTGDQAAISRCLQEFKRCICCASIDDAIAFIRQLYYGVVEDLASRSLVNMPVYYDLKTHMPEMLDEAMAMLDKRFGEGCRIAGALENEPNNFLVTRIKTYVNKNYSDPNLTLTALSDEFGVSTGHISRWFKHFNRIGFIEYLSMVRLDESCKLLNDTELSMAAICKRIGISNVNYYYTIFKKRFGITPTQYRDYCRNSKPDAVASP